MSASSTVYTSNVFIIRMPIPEVLEYHVEVRGDCNTTTYTKWVIQRALPANALTVPIDSNRRCFSSVPVAPSVVGKYVCAKELPAYSTLYFINIYPEKTSNKNKPHPMYSLDADLMFAIMSEVLSKLRQ